MHPLQIEIYRKMSADQKMALVHRLRVAAWELKTVGVRRLHPDWTDERVRAKVRESFLHATS